jgi:hypothetical protein
MTMCIPVLQGLVECGGQFIQIFKTFSLQCQGAQLLPPRFDLIMKLIWPLFKFMIRPDGGKSAAKAARSSIYLASSKEVEGVSGKYFDTNCKEAAWSPAVLDKATREKLWNLVCREVGEN